MYFIYNYCFTTFKQTVRVQLPYVGWHRYHDTDNSPCKVNNECNRN